MNWTPIGDIKGPKGDKGDSGDPADDSTVAGYLGNPTSASSTQLVTRFPLLEGQRGFTQTIYARATGNDSNDGKTAATAFREVRAAVASIAPRGPVFRGTTVVNTGPGTYKGGIALPSGYNPAQDDYIRIVGPAVGGHPNVPTAVISYDADTTVAYGVQANNGAALYLENIKFAGNFYIAVDMRNGVSLQGRNVHISGASAGLGLIKQCIYDWRGGIIENCSQAGIQEHFGITRAFENVTSREQATIIRNCAKGFRAKENCHGHLDWIIFEDNGVGIELQAWSTANIKATTFNRNDVGISLVNAEIHNEGGAVWGTGADANGRTIVETGMSNVLGYSGWTSDSAAPTIDTGHRPLILLASDYAAKTHTGPGTTSETEIYSFSERLKGGMYAVKGKRFEVHVIGSVGASPAGVRVLARVAGQFAAEVKIPQGVAVGSAFQIVFTVLCTEDGDVQKCWGTLTGLGSSYAAVYAVRTLSLADAIDRTVAVSAISDSTAAAVTFQVCELRG